MKEKLLALLVAKFVGVPEATLERIAEKKAGSVTDESQLQSIADSIDYGQIVQSDVDARVTDANKKAVLNYEKRFNLKDGKPVQTNEPGTDPIPPNTGGNDISAIIANAVKTAVEPLQREINGFKAEKTRSQLAEKVKGQLKEKGIPEKFVGDITVESEEEIEDFVKNQESRYTDFKQELVNSGNYVDNPSGGSGPTGGSDADIEKWAEQKNAEVESTQQN